MKKVFCALFGLIAAASLEASPRGMQTFSVADSSQSFCGIRCAVVDKSIEKQSAIAFSLPKIENCYQFHYSLFEDKLECAKLPSGSEIFFPSDGHQPTAADAVRWSCANLEDELITDWYMSMFGLTESNSQLMGFNSKNEACKIINFDPELDKNPTKAAEALAFKATFIANFRKIASVSVGRVLLYRLLLEIRRTDSAGSGCIDEKLGKSLSEDDLQRRNNARTITIKKSDDGNAFCTEEDGFCSIKCTPSKDSHQNKVLDVSTGYLVERPRSDDIGLFHEMLHWFHSLRDPDRKKKEIKIVTDFHDKRTCKSKVLMQSKIISNENLTSWLGKENRSERHPKLTIKPEEFRTIMGYKIKILKKDSGEVVYETDEFINGDDLSENLYRCCWCADLRYGHTNSHDEIHLSEEEIKRMIDFYEHAMFEGGYKKVKH